METEYKKALNRIEIRIDALAKAQDALNRLKGDLEMFGLGEDDDPAGILASTHLGLDEAIGFLKATVNSLREYND